jgi:hypothetical protein
LWFKVSPLQAYDIEVTLFFLDTHLHADINERIVAQSGEMGVCVVGGVGPGGLGWAKADFEAGRNIFSMRREG